MDHGIQGINRFRECPKGINLRDVKCLNCCQIFPLLGWLFFIVSSVFLFSHGFEALLLSQCVGELDGIKSDSHHPQKQDTSLLLGSGQRNGYRASGTFEGDEKTQEEGPRGILSDN